MDYSDMPWDKLAKLERATSIVACHYGEDDLRGRVHALNATRMKEELQARRDRNDGPPLNPLTEPLDALLLAACGAANQLPEGNKYRVQCLAACEKAKAALNGS